MMYKVVDGICKYADRKNGIAIFNASNFVTIIIDEVSQKIFELMKQQYTEINQLYEEGLQLNLSKKDIDQFLDFLIVRKFIEYKEIG